ncbi:hypothetical protein PanWU01x14_037720 [Parasponia andersonii]|uniref:Uncharacterized protein n=1 Tax=Parasponia andersonii TaxID=3476 RepID=A0A2P5DRY2_PARAD|nr:hypothetical protein PanWU01x14_037720 [Parasponia andersonii]
MAIFGLAKVRLEIWPSIFRSGSDFVRMVKDVRSRLFISFSGIKRGVFDTLAFPWRKEDNRST